MPLTFHKKPALVAYVTCGDPDLATTRQIVLAAIEAGADVIVVEGQGALIQAAWGSGKEGYGVLKLMAKTPAEVLEAEPLDVDARGTVLVAGAGITEDALRRADSLHAHGLIVGSLDAGLRRVAESLELPVIVTEGFGHIPMSLPIFEMLSGMNGQEVALNGIMRARGGAVRAEIFLPVITGRFADLGTLTELRPLEVKPGARVRVLSRRGLTLEVEPVDPAGVSRELEALQ